MDAAERSERLAARGATRRIDGVAAPLCSLADLVARQRAAAGPDDLRLLERAHGGLPGPPG